MRNIWLKRQARDAGHPRARQFRSRRDRDYPSRHFRPYQTGRLPPANINPEGQTLHGDHAYVFYQIPVKARKLPLVFWHGHGQFTKTWETTPDGRERFQNIFLRRRYPVYLIDQPRRGHAGRSTQPITITPTPDEQLWFGIFRLGIWPSLFPGVQFSRDPEALNQYFRQMTPNTGPYDMEMNSDAVSTLFNKIGPGILVTYSQSGGLGWRRQSRTEMFEPSFPMSPAATSFSQTVKYLFL